MYIKNLITNISLKILFFSIKIILTLTTQKQQKQIYTYLANIAYKKLKKRTAIAWSNLNFVYADTISDNEKKSIIKKCYLNHMYVLMFFIQYKDMPFDKFTKHITFSNEQGLKKALLDNRKVILVNYHYGLWENCLGMPGVTKEKTIVVSAQFFKQSIIQNTVTDIRSQYKTIVVSHKNNTSKMLSHLMNNDIISIYVDQKTKNKHGIEIDFLGKKTYINKVPAMFAKNKNAVIVPVSHHSSDFYTHNIDIGDPIFPNDKLSHKEDILRMSTLHTRYLEKQIHKDKGLWLWIHRRWSNEYPDIYKDI